MTTIRIRGTRSCPEFCIEDLLRVIIPDTPPLGYITHYIDSDDAEALIMQKLDDESATELLKLLRGQAENLPDSTSDTQKNNTLTPVGATRVLLESELLKLEEGEIEPL